MEHIDPSQQQTTTDTSRELTSISEALRSYRPLLRDPRPTNLEELYKATSSLRDLIPELERYRLDTKPGALEFPRTATALANLGTMLRACDILAKMKDPTIQDWEYQLAMCQLSEEYESFTSLKKHELKLSLKDFITLAELYHPISQSEEGTLTVALGIIYGDLFKMPEIKSAMKERIPRSDVADHDIALQGAFSENNLAYLKDVFPTYFKLSEVARHRISTEVISGVNLGHILQIETCAAALSGLRTVVATDPDGATYWLLPTLMDISAARATSQDSNSWSGSALFNNALTPALLTFAQLLPQLALMGEAKFFDTFQDAIAQRDFYAPIFSDPALTTEQCKVVFRLARYLSWETDNRPVEALVSAFKTLDPGQQELLNRYFMATGLTENDPKVVVTYLPYIFTQLYVKHFPLSEALSRSLDSICGLLQSIEDFGAATRGAGIRTFSGQTLWFTDLKDLSRDVLMARPLSFDISPHDTGTPEIRLQS